MKELFVRVLSGSLNEDAINKVLEKETMEGHLLVSLSTMDSNFHGPKAIFGGVVLLFEKARPAASTEFVSAALADIPDYNRLDRL